MTGTLAGNILGTIYFAYFQLAGILLALFALKKEKIGTKLIVGSTVGSMLMQWLCVLFSFVFDFTITAHIFAAAFAVPLFAAAIYYKEYIKKQFTGLSGHIKRHSGFAVLFAMVFVLWCFLLNSHIIPTDANGAVHTGQCTYGDMSMHLGFISSIATQKSFPPVYSIFPNLKLAYPFLNASISSSIYLLGATLRWAYILPMLAAFLQVCGGVYLLAVTVLGSRAKGVLSCVLLLFNGGLGFVYFTGLTGSGLTVKDIFTGYYTTPTNLVDHNIRWANIIADILLPQRASLFGYALLFTAIWLLYRAVWNDKKIYFVYAGIFAGALPLVHTHSFLAMGLVSAAWLLLWLYRKNVQNDKQKWYGTHMLVIFVAVMCTLQFINNKYALSSRFFFAFGICGIALCVMAGIYLLVRYICKNGYEQLLKGWGIYLAMVLVLALPQLVGWTFGQVAEGGFLRGHFNWGNLGDFYPWFYIKNIGAPLVIIVAAICKGSGKTSPLIAAAGVIWFVAELILFTPNTYDNNKLLYVAYMMLCIAAADFAVDRFLHRKKASEKSAAVVTRYATATIFILLCTVSAVLTLGREAVSDYVLYSSDHMALAEYVQNNTDIDDVFLTNTRHNNEIACLTGRSIVCGSDIFLFYHGIDTTQRKADVRQMYENVAQSKALYEKYSVDYVVVSSWEKSNYYTDIPLFEQLFEKVFEQGGVAMYKVK